MKSNSPTIYFLFIALVSGCSLQQQTKTQDQPAVKVTDQASLISSKKEMHDSSIIYRFPFDIDNNQRDASLTLDFVVIDKGHCPVTYTPTVISVNGQQIDEIDFRELEYKEHYKFDIPISQSVLVVGRNQVEIVTGECSFDIDDMVMNDMKITLQ